MCPEGPAPLHGAQLLPWGQSSWLGTLWVPGRAGLPPRLRQHLAGFVPVPGYCALMVGLDRKQGSLPVLVLPSPQELAPVSPGAGSHLRLAAPPPAPGRAVT